MADDFAILAAIDASPAHPYELLDHLHLLGVEASRGALHRRVETLMTRGILEPGEQVHGLRLTEQGQRILAEHTITVLGAEPLDSPLFALAASSARSDRSGLLHTILRSRMASAATRLSEEQIALAASAENERYWSRVGRERIIAHLEADIAWLRAVMSDADDGPAADAPNQLPQAS